ncbi:MAG: hypothetical protein EPN38_08970 [Rhodanobacteraceae bacterium]|nr:MAG: hypothetical protein EPN38_08970 [Rhodanobacteraceae bacterium]
MTIQRSIRLTLAGAIVAALFGAAAVATAQQPPAAPMQPQTTGTATTARFYQGTETTATYALPDSHGGTLTVRAGMPAQVPDYGPPPAFQALDTNHDGRISEAEAAAYPPLDSDFLFASQQGKYITAAQYKRWVSAQH